MAERKSPPNLDELWPDDAAIEAVLNGPTEFKSKADPRLVARMEELNRLSSSPEILRVAPPSATAYVPPTELRADTKVARPEARVELALPSSRHESPTMPSLKRLEGEPELPGVVQAPSPGARGVLRVSARGAALTGLAVFCLLLVILLVGRTTTGRSERGGAASATAPVPTATQSASPTPTATAVPKTNPSSEPAPSVDSSARPSPTASAAVPLHTGAALKHPPPRASEDPYDPPAMPAVTAPPHVTAAPPPVAPPPIAPPAIAPSVPSTGPGAPAQKPEF